MSIALNPQTQIRLRETVAVECPFLDGTFRIGIFGESSTVTFQPTAGATPQHIAAAQQVIDTFDWSDAPNAAYFQAKEPALKNLRDAAQQAIVDIDAYLAIADTATAAQVRTEVQNIDQRQKKIIQALVRLAEIQQG